MTEIETQRLIIRPFRPDDWEGIRTLAVDKEALKKDPADPPWPVTDEGCKEFTEYLTKMTDKFLAVCLKRDKTPIGLLAFNRNDENRQLELGYQIHSRYQDNDIDREVLKGIIEFIFEHKNAKSIDTRTNPEWTEQIAPLKWFGFTPIEGDPGHLGITKEEWVKRGS